MDDATKAKLRNVQARQRAAHQMLFNIQGQAIDSLFDCIRSVKQTQDEMVKLFEADSEGEDLVDEK